MMRIILGTALLAVPVIVSCGLVSGKGKFWRGALFGFVYVALVVLVAAGIITASIGLSEVMS